MPTFPALPSPNPWTPRFQASFIEPLMVTYRNLVLRDQVAALAWASSDITLQPFAASSIFYSRLDEAVYKSRQTVYPLMLIQPGRTTPETGPEEVSIPEEVNTLVVTIVVAGGDPNNLTLQIVRYVKAADLIWRSASFADLTWNLDLSHTTRPAVDVIEHSYNAIISDSNTYYHAADLTLTANFMEK